jgi:hypothetical protein
MVDSDTATNAEIDAAEVEVEKTVHAFVELDKTLLDIVPSRNAVLGF